MAKGFNETVTWTPLADREVQAANGETVPLQK